MPKKYVVELTSVERQRCLDLIRAGQARARSLMHAQVLLKADCGPEGPRWTDKQIGEAFAVSTVTVATVRKTFVTEGLEATVRHYRTGTRVYRRKLDGRQEAHLVALACSAPPEGQARWTLRLLADRMVELGYVDELSRCTVGNTLKKTNCSPGAASSGASRPAKTRGS